ncbi:MAG: DUF1667 domain-containing protein [Clostridia bacterium]|nr:DUF1667 domain-containing protein [Clostridia bacterium]
MRELTCIICPIGCSLTVQFENGCFQSVTGNRCPKGAQYAEDECTHPKRTVTSTVRTEDGRVLSVKTDVPIPKEHIFDCMKRINGVKCSLPIFVGDVIIENVFGSRVVATQNMQKQGGGQRE